MRLARIWLTHVNSFGTNHAGVVPIDALRHTPCLVNLFNIDSALSKRVVTPAGLCAISPPSLLDSRIARFDYRLHNDTSIRVYYCLNIKAGEEFVLYPHSRRSQAST